ncbi:restriction endonuclease subunit S [Macrococcoides caseolyticum]|uniref:restriction endonuclease subunit S n=1 Tax=Macrococcoides caseolyticum TaxID=69966 RepID=UPI002A244A13|nr:restriction endonuclease subunit S [Macrococcus caseolyticus]
MDYNKLLNSILKLAMQGKLIQHEKEENVEKVIKEIAQERKKLGLKKKLPYYDTQNEENIPSHWRYVNLEFLTYNIGSKQNQVKQSEIMNDGLYPVVSQSINQIEGYINDSSKILDIQGNSVIVFGDHSKTLKIIDFNFVIGADGTKIMVPIKINQKFLYYALKYNLINITDRGYSRHFQFLKNKPIPFPPLKEQYNIVLKIEELLPKIERYRLLYEESSDINKIFPEKFKKSILQYAIKGELSFRDHRDTSVDELYNTIQLEKVSLLETNQIKKIKKFKPISSSEIPFDIPESWKWVRLGEIFNIKMGQSPKGNNVTEEKSGLEFHQGKIHFGELYLKPSKVTTKQITKMVNPESILLCVRAPVGILNITKRKICIGRGLCGIETLGAINPLFALYFLQAFQNDFIKKATGSTFKAINLTTIEQQLFPLPPLQEQERILASIQNLLNKQNKLSKIQ